MAGLALSPLQLRVILVTGVFCILCVRCVRKGGGKKKKKHQLVQLDSVMVQIWWTKNTIVTVPGIVIYICLAAATKGIKMCEMQNCVSAEWQQARVGKRETGAPVAVGAPSQETAN